MATPAEIYRKQASGEITPAEAARQIAELRAQPATPAAAKPTEQEIPAPWYERAYEAVVGSGEEPAPPPKRPSLDMDARKDAATLETTIRATERAAGVAEVAKQRAKGAVPEDVAAAGEEARAEVAEKYPLRTGELPDFTAQPWMAIAPRYMGDSVRGVAEEGQSLPMRVAQAAGGTAGAFWHGASRAAADFTKGVVEGLTPVRFDEPSEADPEGDRIRLMHLFEGVDVGRYAGDAVGHAFEAASMPAFVSPSNPVAMAVTPKGASEGAALVPIETPVGTGLRVAGGADEAAFVAAVRRPMEWTGLVPERENAWRAKAPWGLGYVSDVLQTINTGEGFGDLLTEHADYVGPTIAGALGPGAAELYKSNVRTLGRAADFFLPFGSAYAAAGRASTIPMRARDLANATGVDLKAATAAVAGEDLPSWITKSKITDVGAATAARVDATLKAGGELPPRLKADMADMLARDLNPHADTLETDGGALKGTAIEGDGFLEFDEPKEAAPSGVDDLLRQAADTTNPGAALGARRQLVDLASEAAKRRARASLGDDLVVTMPGRRGEPLVVSAKEYESVLSQVATKAKALGFNGRDIVDGRLTPMQRALLYSELRRSGYEGPLPGEIDFTPQREGFAGEGEAPGEVNPGASPRWRGPSPIDERAVQEPSPDFDRTAYNLVVESMVERAAGRAAQQRYAIRAYSPLAEYAGRTLAGKDRPLAMPSWYTAIGRVVSPNPATADVPLVLRSGLEHRLRMGEQVASDVRDRIVDSAESGRGLGVMFDEGLIDDLPDMAYVDQLKAAASDIAFEQDARKDAARMEADLKKKAAEEKKALDEALKTEDQTTKKEHERARTAVANKRHELKQEQQTGRQAKEATLKAATATLEEAKRDASVRLASEALAETKSFDEDAAVVNFRDVLEREGEAAKRAEDKILAILSAHITDANLLEQAALVMAANTRSWRWRPGTEPAGQKNVKLANGYQWVVEEGPDGKVTGTTTPPDMATAIKAKRAMRAKLVAVLGPTNADLGAFKSAWTEFSNASTLHQKAQRDMNEGRTTLRKDLNRVNTSVADIRTPFESRDVASITRPAGQQLVRDAKELIAEELAAKTAAEAEGPPPPLPLDHPAVAKADEVKAAQRAADRAARDLAEHDNKVEKLKEAIGKAEARLEAAKVAMERHRAAVAVELAKNEFDRMRENEGSIPAATVAETAQKLGEVDPQVRVMLDAAVAERAGDKPMTPERKAHLELQVLNERITYERHRAQRLASQIESAFVPEAKRTHASDPMPAEYGEKLVKALLKIPEDDGASIMALLQTRYGADAIDDVGGGLFRMAVDRALDAWMADTVDWMVSVGLAIPTKHVDPRFTKAVHDALAGTSDIHLADGRFTSTHPDHYRQAASSLLTRWGLSERAVGGSNPLAPIGKPEARAPGDTRAPESFATAEPIARAVESARNRAKMPSWAWSETREFGDTNKRTAVGEATGRLMSNWKLSKVIGYTGMRAPAFIFGNIVTMPFIMDASLGQRQTYQALGQYARNPGFMAAVLDLHTGGGRWEDPSYHGRYLTTATGQIVSAVDVARLADKYQIDSSQPHVEFARDMYDEVLAALDRPTQIGPLGKILKGLGIHGQTADIARYLEIRAKGVGREIAGYHAMIWEIVRAVDSTARLSALVDGLEQGLSVDHAANNARESALDYGKLNSTERFTIRRLVPFYAFQRRMMAAYRKNPTAFARHARMLRTHENDYGGDEERGWDPNPGRISIARFQTPSGEAIFDTSAPNAGLLETTMALAGVLRSIVRQEREPGPTVALPGLDEGLNKLASQLGPLQMVGEFVSGEVGGSGRDLEPGGFEGRMPSWITNTPPLFFLFDAAFDLRPRPNKDPAYGPVGDMQWYVNDPRYYRAFAALSTLDSELPTLTRYFAVAPAGPLKTSPEESAYGGGTPLGIFMHRSVARPTDMQMTLERAKLKRKVDKEKSDYSHVTPK